MSDEATPERDLARIVESARRLGIEMDEAEALQWLGAMAAREAGGDIVMDTAAGVFGHRVTMLDFSPEELGRFREIGRLVEFEDRPGRVETALALSGSAAQSRIQTYPGDCDFFERVNILAPTREAACAVLADLMREKILATAGGPDHRFIEAKFGSYPEDVVRDGETMRAGSPIAWGLEDARAGRIEAERPDGSPVWIEWDRVAADPGWCKLDWVVADPIRHRLANASNMLDATWESPDGDIIPLDGQLDPYYQEVYLEAASIPIFSKLAKRVLPDALDEYVRQLEGEIEKYVTRDPNYGKVAKRMYNVFRLSGRYREAVYIRELFDEPATVLYQVAAVIRTVDEAAHSGSGIAVETLLSQTDELMESVQAAREHLQDEDLTSVLSSLARLRDQLEAGGHAVDRATHVHDARERVEAAVNHFFRERLEGVEEIREYLAGLAS